MRDPVVLHVERLLEAAPGERLVAEPEADEAAAQVRGERERVGAGGAVVGGQRAARVARAQVVAARELADGEIRRGERDQRDDGQRGGGDRARGRDARSSRSTLARSTASGRQTAGASRAGTSSSQSSPHWRKNADASAAAAATATAGVRTRARMSATSAASSAPDQQREADHAGLGQRAQPDQCARSASASRTPSRRCSSGSKPPAPMPTTGRSRKRVERDGPVVVALVGGHLPEPVAGLRVLDRGVGGERVPAVATESAMPLVGDGGDHRRRPADQDARRPAPARRSPRSVRARRPRARLERRRARPRRRARARRPPRRGRGVVATAGASGRPSRATV